VEEFVAAGALVVPEVELPVASVSAKLNPAINGNAASSGNIFIFINDLAFE
jgi:hypothetical protein